MSRRITNFDYEIFSPGSGFQSVCARTVPGRTVEYNGWCSSQWPTFNFGSEWPHHHTMAAPPPFHHGHHNHHHHHHASHTTPFYPPPRRSHHHPHHNHPSIMGGFFDPLHRRATEVETFADKQVIRLRSEVFRDVKPTVQVKGDTVKVFAARVRTGSSAHGTVRQDNEFEYSTTVSPAYDAKRMVASRHGDELVITVPRK